MNTLDSFRSLFFALFFEAIIILEILAPYLNFISQIRENTI